MRNRLKRGLASMLTAVMTISCLGSGMSMKSYAKESVTQEELTLNVKTEHSIMETEEVSGQYAIYPIPQEVVYGEGEVIITEEVAIVADTEVDEATMNYVKEVLDDYHITYETASAVIEGKTNILLGIRGSKGVAEQYISDVIGGVEVTAANIWEQPDAHVVDVRDNRFVIYGKDTDSVFHGVSTLKMMFSSFQGAKFPTVHIEDYAAVESRGFIEGFYGSWNHQARMDLMRFAKDYKMNSYIYAAKNDAYHTSKWSQLYPESMLKEFEELVQVGEETKVRFGWSIHMGSFFNGLRIPDDATMESEGYGALTEYNDYRTRYAQLMEKFKQLISIGVRRFDILNDDFGSGSHSDVVKVLNRINRDLKALGCESITYCPQGYNKSWANKSGTYPELIAMQNLDEDIKIYWTGDDVNAPVTQSTVTFVTEQSGHQPDFWLNYPVNEHAKSGIFLGHIKHYARDGVTGMAGFHSNPCRYPYASQVGLYQLAALVWNNNDYLANAEKIWESAFDYLQPEVRDAYFKIANNISNAPGSSRVGNAFPESDYIEELLNTVSTEITSGQNYKDSENVAALRAEFAAILGAIEEFETNCEKQELVAELTPWLKSLRDVTTAGRDILDSAVALQTGDLSVSWEKLSSASAAYSTAYTYQVNAEDNNFAKAGSKRIYPFVTTLISYVTNSLTPMLNPDHAEAIPTAFVKLGGAVQSDDTNAKKMYDGDATTFANWNIVQEAGDYVGLDFGRVIRVTDVKIVQGETDTHHDILHDAVLQYSEDNEHWQEIDAEVTLDGHVITAENLDLNARYVRYYLKTKGYGGKIDYWTRIREFTVNKPVPTGDRVYTNVESLKETPVTYEGTKVSLRDLGSVSLKPGDYVGIKLENPTIAYSFESDLTNASELTLEYSYNEEVWAAAEAETANVAMKYLRLMNKTDARISADINKIEAKLQQLQGEPKLLTSTMNGGVNNGNFGLVFDSDRSTYVETKNNQQADNYITFDFGKNIEVHDVTLVTTDGNQTFSQAKVQLSSDNLEWEDIGVINNNMTFEVPYKHFTCNGNGTQARYLRIYVTANYGYALKLHEVEINKLVEGGTQAEEVVSSLSGNVKNIIDGNISTAFMATAKAGDYVEYRISDNVNLTKVNVLMAKAGNGKVYAVKPEGEKVLLGTLEKTVSEFDTASAAPVTSVRLEWEQAEEIAVHEISVVRGVYAGTDIGVYVDPIWINTEGETTISNLAIGKQVTVSGTSDGNKDNVNDGDMSTKWDSNKVAKTDEGTETAWISIDLGDAEVYGINRLIISYFNKIYPTRYTVEVSEDGTEWTQVGEEQTRESSAAVTHPVDTIEFDAPVKARYVKLNFKKLNFNAAGPGVGIKEFEIYGGVYKEEEPTPEVKEYTITFNSGEGASEVGSQTVEENGKAVEPEEPTKEGYDFAGWKLDGKSYDFNTPVTGDITLEAEWTAHEYSIAFKGNKSTSGSMAVLSDCQYGESYTLTQNAFKRSGYTFVGWNTKADGSGTAYADKASVRNLTSTNGETVTLYAQWKRTRYSITYVLKGGENSSKNPESYTKVTSTITLKNPTRDGYTFKGWYSDSKYTKRVKTIQKGSTGNKTLYAKWEAKKYDITYKLNGGKNSSKNPKSYRITTSDITLKNPTRTGYTFAGWYSDSKYTNKVETIEKGSIGDKKLYAKWEAKQYSITYNLNGGKNSSKNPESYTIEDSKITLKNPIRKGYTFKGWYSDSKYTKRVKTISEGSIGNKKLYAKWSKK